MNGSELLLLGLLTQQRMHGYELHEFIEKRLHLVSDLTKPTAYRLLESLHEAGLVTRRAEREGRRPERLVYDLTEKGRERLQSLLREQLGQADRIVYPGNAALLFADQLSAGERRSLLLARRDAVAERLSGLRAAREHHPPGTGARLVIDHDSWHLAAEIEWLERAVAAIPADVRSDAEAECLETGEPAHGGDPS